MALTSVYYDGPVTETDRAENRGGVPDYGVYGAGDFNVTAHPSIPYAVLVKAGRAHGYGVTDTATEDQVVQCASLASGTRWDLIVVRRNWQPELGGPSTLEVIQVGADPVIPDAPARKIEPGVEDDQPLALVKWQGGTSAPVQFIDLRCWAANGGVIAKDQLALGYLARVGAEVRIGGTVWQYRLGDNDSPGWVPLPDVTIVPGATIAGSDKPANVPWKVFSGLVTRTKGAGGDTSTTDLATDGNGFGGFWFGEGGLPTFQGINSVQLTAFHPLPDFLFIPEVVTISTTRIKYRARRLDGSGWANGYGSLSCLVTVIGW
jgi:hypothetical protein